MGASPAQLEMVRRVAGQYGVPWELLAGIVQTESAWNPRAHSSAGAIGLGQVMPWWAKELGIRVDDLWDPEINLSAAAAILKENLQTWGGDWAKAAMSYNGGPAMVRSAIKAAGSDLPEILSPKLRAQETQDYWKRVLNWAAVYAGISTPAQAVEAIRSQSVLPAAASAAKAGGALLLLLLVGAAALAVSRA